MGSWLRGSQHRSHQDLRARADIPGERKKHAGWNFLPGTPVSAKENREYVGVDQMMYVQSLKLLDALRARRERERSESIEPGDDAAAVSDGAFRSVVFNERPAAQQCDATWLRD